MDADSITDVGNYSIEGLEIEEVSIVEDGDINVLITTSSQLPSTEYSLVYEVKDAAGNSTQSDVLIKSFFAASHIAGSFIL